MHLVGYFEGIDSERGLEWRCSDSLSLRAFLRLGSRDRVPDHSCGVRIGKRRLVRIGCELDRIARFCRYDGPVFENGWIREGPE